MELSVKVVGQIEEVQDRYDRIIIKGKLDRLVVGNSCCETEAILLLKRYSGVIIEGLNPYVDKYENALVFVTGEITGIALLNEEGRIVDRYKVISCCLKLKKIKTETED